MSETKPIATEQLLIDYAKDSTDFDDFFWKVRRQNIPDGEGGYVLPTIWMKILKLDDDRHKNTEKLKKFYDKHKTRKMDSALRSFDYNISEAVEKKFYKPGTYDIIRELTDKLKIFIQSNTRVPDVVIHSVFVPPQILQKNKRSQIQLSVYFKFPEGQARKKQNEIQKEIDKIIDFYISEQLDSDLSEYNEAHLPEKSFLNKLASGISHAATKVKNFVTDKDNAPDFITSSDALNINFLDNPQNTGAIAGNLLIAEFQKYNADVITVNKGGKKALKELVDKFGNKLFQNIYGVPNRKVYDDELFAVWFDKGLVLQCESGNSMHGDNVSLYCTYYLSDYIKQTKLDDQIEVRLSDNTLSDVVKQIITTIEQRTKIKLPRASDELPPQKRTVKEESLFEIEKEINATFEILEEEYGINGHFNEDLYIEDNSKNNIKITKDSKVFDKRGNELVEKYYKLLKQYQEIDNNKEFKKMNPQIPPTTATTELEAANLHITAPTETKNASPVDTTYIPASDACATLDTTAPELLRYEMLKAIETVDRRVNGVDEYVSEKLGFHDINCTMEEKQQGIKCLCDAFGAEQIDALAMAIFNVENRHESTIIGDMTGIGKGRVAAGVMEYARLHKKIPIFFTAKANLFSDMARDLVAIGADAGIPQEFLTTETRLKKRTVTRKEITEAREQAIEDGVDPDEAVEQLWLEAEAGGIEMPVYIPNKNYKEQCFGKKRFVPFIINANDTRTAVQDEEGNILYRPLAGNSAERNEAMAHAGMPKGYDGVFLTYSQISGSKRSEAKRKFLMSLAPEAIIIMDESHNAAGDSNTGKFMKELLKACSGAVFLSATFAKRPDNMPIYAAKTAIQDAELDDTQLVDAVRRGGVALQEILASMLTREGEHIRRERSYEGVEVNYMYLDSSQREGNSPHPEFDLKDVHRAVADSATELLRDIMEFQKQYVKPAIEKKNERLKSRMTKGTEEGGINNMPVFNGVFQLISQMLFSIKASVVAQHAVNRLKEGRKPVIAFSSTMESFLNRLTNDEGMQLRDGEVIADDFSHVFLHRLKNCTKYTVTNPDGTAYTEYLIPEEMGEDFMNAYAYLEKKIKQTVTGISLSPIDVLYYHIQNAGFTVEEVTGRKNRLKINGDGTAIYTSRVFRNAKETFRMFNDNEIDCIMINRAGSTGASAHAIPTKKVPKDKVKQRCMIILQAELDINEEVQKRGRIFRTGQIFKPIYDYVISAVPAEKRYMIMLQHKLSSLDANTTSNQKQSTAILDTDDFLNKYGDRIVLNWLFEHMSIYNNQLGAPFGNLNKLAQEYGGIEHVPVPADCAHRTSGRIAVLPTKQQEQFYDEVIEQYKDTVFLLKQSGEYDLEVGVAEKLEAETEEKMIVSLGSGDKSIFSRHAILEKCIVNNLSKPYKSEEVRAMVEQTLTDADGNKVTVEEYTNALKSDVKAYAKAEIERMAKYIETDTQNDLEKFRNSPIWKLELEKNGITQKDIDMRVEEKARELEAEKATRLHESENYENSQAGYINTFIDFFRPGKVVAYPLFVAGGDINNPETTFIKGIFVGFAINKSTKNPYAKSNIKLRFALAGSQRYRVVPLSKLDIISQCRDMTRTRISSNESYEYMLKIWNSEIKKASADRIYQYIVTGNILKALAKSDIQKGKLIRFTTIKGGVRNGVLMTYDFKPEGTKRIHGEDEKPVRVTVPITYALHILQDSEPDTNPIETSLGITIVKKHNTGSTGHRGFVARDADKYIYEVMMPSKKDFAKYYAEDQVLVGLTKNQFNKVATNMRGEVPENKLQNLLDYLKEQYNATASLSRAQFDHYVKPHVKMEEYTDEESPLPIQEKILDDLQQQDREAEKMIDEKNKEEAVNLDAEKTAEDDAAARIKQLEDEAELNRRRASVAKKFAKVNVLLELGV